METASLGVALTEGRQGTNPADLLAAADGALYASKHAGRNRVTVAQVPSAGVAEGWRAAAPPAPDH